MQNLKNYIILMRVEQWVKNVFVLLPLFFSGGMLQQICWLQAFLAFLAFSLAASAVYALNDVVDASNDRLHPLKHRRPVASGAVGIRAALTLAVVCALMAVAVGWLTVNVQVAGVIVVYLLLNLAYCLRLKQIAIVDVFVLSLGYILRLQAGGWATHTHLSHWIVLMTFLLALFLALAKRRDDVLIYEQKGVTVRASVSRYNLPFVNMSMAVVSAVMIVCYVMYTVSPEVTSRLQTSRLYLTTLFVVAGVFRYLQITFVENRSGNPTLVMIKDRFIQICIAMWLLAFVFIIYF
jgi:4-hydroxybenzoate polyprenyltransferase